MKILARCFLWLVSLGLGAVGVATYPHRQSAAEETMAAGLTNAAGLDPITADRNVQRCICKLWQMGGYGFRPTEAGMDIVKSKEGGLSCRFWPFAHLYHRAASPDNWPLDDVAAIAHTHPRKGAVQSPADHDYLDTLDDYVVSADGIFSAGRGCTKKKDKTPCTRQPVGPEWHKEWCE